MGTIFTDVCKHSPCKINQRAICWPEKQKPKSAVALPRMLCALPLFPCSPLFGCCEQEPWPRGGVYGAVNVLQADASLLWPHDVSCSTGMWE